MCATYSIGCKERSPTSSITSHLSAVMTTAQVDVTQTTGKNTVTSSSSPGADFYFACAVIVIGIVGTAANALILYALVASKQHKKQVLIVNQNVLDLLSRLFLALTYALKISNISLSGVLGYWLCMLLLSENILWCATNASVINLCFIAIERYLKIVHSVWSKKKLRIWMTHSSTALPWIISFSYNMTAVFTTSAVIDGVCHGYVIFENSMDKMVHGVSYFLSFYASSLIFVLCYWRILVAIRRQARVMTSHSTVGTAQATAAQAKDNQIQSNVIKTMILVCAFFAIAWLPGNVYYLLVSVDVELTLRESSYYAVIFISFLYICVNPFIYATKFDPVKRTLMRLIPCKKDQQPVHSVDIKAPTTRTTAKARCSEM